MTPAPYSPHGLVVPRSYEPLPLALQRRAFLPCWFLALGPLESLANETYRVVLVYVGHKRQA